MFDWFALAGRILRRIDPETAHGLAIRALRSGLVPALPCADDARLAIEVWGRRFPNPVGLAAGFDKNAEVASAMFAHGFGFVEVGTVTPRPQAGNPKPRLFRLTNHGAVINRMGFNNDGSDVVARRIAALRAAGIEGIIGANIGPNRDSDDPVADCKRGVSSFAGLADYLVVNVSSPNTPGLRQLQEAGALRALLGASHGARDGAAGRYCPLLVKIAPDLAPEDLAAIAEVALEFGVDGIVATNTTVERPPPLTGLHRDETGGLSGRPLFARSTAIISELYRLTNGTIPLIGVGGIASGADAYTKIRAGASLVQLYTALVFHGPGLVSRIKDDLVRRLQADGFSSLANAVGADHR